MHPTTSTHFRVYLIALASGSIELYQHKVATNPSDYDQHALYVDCVEGKRGVAYQVVGNIVDGHEFKCLPDIVNPGGSRRPSG